MKYTVWVCSMSGRGTHHVSAHEAETIDEAKELAIDETLEDWDYDPAAATTLHVLGVCEGDVKVLEWNEHEVFGDD